jgi:hypothetical protein
MKLYNIDPESVYPDARMWPVRGHEDRAVIVCTDHMSDYVFYPRETDGLRLDGSVLFSECMGFDPETFDGKSEKVRRWVEEWSYPVEMAKAIVAQINHK